MESRDDKSKIPPLQYQDATRPRSSKLFEVPKKQNLQAENYRKPHADVLQAPDPNSLARRQPPFPQNRSLEKELLAASVGTSLHPKRALPGSRGQEGWKERARRMES
eukprot:scaffold263455_cov14-Tisochrysis_lutea.AAC.1